MNTTKAVRTSLFLFSTVLLIGLSACSKGTPEITDQNLRTNAAPVDSMIEGFRVVRNDVLAEQVGTLVEGSTILSATSGEASKFLRTSPLVDERTRFTGKFPTKEVPIPEVDPVKDTLILGLPIGILGEERVLGGVITEVSNHENEELGSLKLSDYPMVHGRLLLAALDTNTPQLILVGCEKECKEASPRVPLIAFPITAVDTEKQLLMIDLSAVGKNLDLITLADPDGSATGLKSISTIAKTFDYSVQTLIFDIESKLTAVNPEENPMEDTNLTVRWFLKSSAAFDSSFEVREPTPGVGFFTTDTAANPKIKRWSLASMGENGIKYYLKNIPAEWQAAFAAGFDDWNDQLEPILGRKMLSYEFIPEGDPRNALLVTGDIRYNIMEWDLVNKAGYGGLGPSECNEYTGEDISANVLIQGPTIMKLYTDWYKVSAEAKALLAMGKAQEADALVRDFSVAADARIKEPSLHRLTRNQTAFRIFSELPELSDPLAQRNDFEETPPNVDFKTYMFGYFHDMVTHELGHNIGLRHNFRGNMGATDSGAQGSTSRSVMEYLNRRYRYLDKVGEYDIMAIKYGYLGEKPAHLNWFCTDENNWNPKNKLSSPECSSDDATSDPFTYYEFRLGKAIDYLTARGQSYAPVWNLADMKRELGVALKGHLSYATMTELNSALTNFYGKGRHPSELKLVKDYVIASVKQQLCDPNLDLVIAGKYDVDAQRKTRDNINALREKALAYFKDGGIDLGFDLNCK